MVILHADTYAHSLHFKLNAIAGWLICRPVSGPTTTTWLRKVWTATTCTRQGGTRAKASCTLSTWVTCAPHLTPLSIHPPLWVNTNTIMKANCKRAPLFELQLNMRQDLVSVIMDMMNPSTRDHVVGAGRVAVLVRYCFARLLQCEMRRLLISLHRVNRSSKCRWTAQWPISCF